jgi:alpha-L-rhamnosidase
MLRSSFLFRLFAGASLLTTLGCGTEGAHPPGAAGGAAGGLSSSGGGAGTFDSSGTGGGPAGSGGSSAAGGAGLSGGAGATSGGADGGMPGGPMQVTRMRTEYRTNPLGIDVKQPRFDWWLASDQRGQRQTAYQILVASSEANLAADRGDLWDSGKVVSTQSIQVVYRGSALISRQRAWWKVRVWDKDDVPSAYSAAASWEMGPLAPSDWTASWIGGGASFSTSGVFWIWYPEGDPSQSAPAGTRYFRRSFQITSPSDVSSATCTAAADNQFDLYVNGTRVGGATDWHLTPTFDVRSSLVLGNNVVAIQATNADGPAGVLAQCRFEFTNAMPVVITSDRAWKSANAPAANWQATSFDDSAWPAAKEVAPLGQGPWGQLSIAAGGPAPYLRKTFTAPKAVTRARIYATALGLYELWLNGKRVGIDRFTPGWTDYNKRLQVQTYDVTSLVAQGNNALGAILGDGWFQGKVGYLGRSTRYGAGPAHLKLQLELEYQDGQKQTIVSDGTWKTKTGPILFADELDGETYDARLEMPGWDGAAFDDSAWRPATVIADTARNLVADVTPGVQVIQEITAKTVKPTASGSYVFDLGQNMVGWARLRMRGAAGSTATLRFAEVLNPDGTPYYANLRGAKATDQYVFNGAAGEEVYEPRFTFHGFRYVELSGVSPAPAASAITGIVLHSATPPTGTFVTSSAMVNQLQSNIVWGQKGNFFSVPTDCPQRDERLGWMGDALIFVRTATFNMDVASFFTKWTRDVDDGQTAAGAFGNVSPSVDQSGTPAWGDAGLIVPWTMYLAYGDTRILEEHYPAMVRWVEYVRGLSTGNLWQTSRGSDFGDWLSIADDTDKAVLASAFYAHAADLVSRAAAILGKDADAKKYADLFTAIKAAFNTAYVSNNGTIKSDTQTVYALALRFNLLPDNLRAAAASMLDAGITRHGGHLSTGFVGVSHLLPALTAGGKLDRAYTLLNNDTYPSWGYEIAKGATTIWERWDGIQANGQFQDPTMNSFNHYSFGSVGEWMYATVGGIELDETHPGFERFAVRPRPGGGLTSAKTSFDSIHGTIVSDWTASASAFMLKVTVPVNTTATVYLPFGTDVRESGSPPPPKGVDGGYTIGSGTYSFTAAAP